MPSADTPASLEGNPCPQEHSLWKGGSKQIAEVSGLCLRELSSKNLGTGRTATQQHRWAGHFLAPNLGFER